MKPYELVVVLKASLPADEKKALVADIVSIIGADSIKQTDDMGVLNAAYPLSGKKENSVIHIISYHIQIDSKNIIGFSKKFAYLKGLLRHFFYAMGVNEEFVTYADMQKKLETVVDQKPERIVK